jgi:hypothetical protein
MRKSHIIGSAPRTGAFAEDEKIHELPFMVEKTP